MEKDILVTCPYNSSHRVRQYKLISHMVKCKRHNDKGDKAVCPLNNSHIIDRDKMAEHIASCPSLSSLIQDNVDEEVAAMPAISADTHKSFEDWDQLPEVPSYNPMENSAKKKVYRCVSGFSNAERRKFRRNERERIANLNGVNITGPSLPPSRDTDEMPLRPPRGQAEVLCNAGMMQHGFHKREQIHDSNIDVLTKPTISNEFRDTFHKALYNELLSDCEPNKEEDTCVFNHKWKTESEDFTKLRNSSMKKPTSSENYYRALNDSSSSLRTSAGNYSRNADNEAKHLPTCNQNQETETEEAQTDIDMMKVSQEMLNFCNTEENNACIENIRDTSTPHTSKKHITDNLLALLRDNANVKEEPAMEMGKDTEPRRVTSEWDEAMRKFNVLTDIHNAVYEQGTLLMKQLNDLKLSKNSGAQASNDDKVLRNRRCAANFSENMSADYEAQLKNTVLESQETSVNNNLNTYECSLNGDSNTSNIKDDKSNKVYNLKTPEDFC